MENRKTVRVTGRAQVKLTPDRMRVTVTLSGAFPAYAEALERSAADTEVLRTALAGPGFAKEDLKTLRFDIEPEYEGYNEEGVYRQRLTGYRYTHAMKLDFDFDNARLGEILCVLSASPLQPEFTVGYTVKDPEAAKNELLAKAVADAKAKAQVLAAAAGVKLGGILSINYTFADSDFEVRPVNRMMAADELAVPMAAKSFDIGITPEDVTAADAVTVIWAIA